MQTLPPKKINVFPIHFHSPQNPTNGKASGSMSLRFLQCTFINLQTLIFLMGIPQVGFPIICLSPLHLTLYPNPLYISYPNPTFLMQTLPKKKNKIKVPMGNHL